MKPMYVLTRLFLAVVLAAGVLVSAGADEKKEPEKKEPEKKQPEKKSGTVVGLLTDKGEKWIEVKGDGEEKARRYTPNWVGQNLGGLDPKMVAVIRELKVGSRVRVEWEFDERARVVKVEVLKPAADKKDK
jgi:hypothetical protein